MKNTIRKIPAFLLLALASVALFACGAPAPEDAAASVSEAVVTPVTVDMWITPGTVCPTPPPVGLRLVEDASHPSSTLAVATMLNGGPVVDTYNPSTHTAIPTATSTEWSAMCSALATGPFVRIYLTYDSSASGTNKPLIYPNPGGQPEFALCSCHGAGCGTYCN